MPGGEKMLLPRAFCIHQGFLLGRFFLADRADGSVVNQQFALAGWTLAPRIEDDGVHRSKDDLPLAERAGKRMVEKIEFDGAHCEIVSKLAFAAQVPAPGG